MRNIVLALALSLAGAGAAHAQPAQDAPPAAPAPSMSMSGPGGHPHMSFRARFEAANVTHDGKLTQQQAEDGGMRKVAAHFAEIDHDNKGYVTLDDVSAWMKASRAAKGGAPAPGAAPAGSPQY
jgi:hypothetical protein